MVEDKKATYLVFLYRKEGQKEGQWQKIAQVCESTNSISFLDHESRFENQNLHLLSIHEKKLVHAFMQTEIDKSKIYLLHQIETKDEKDEKQTICSHFLHALYYRRATIYIMLQTTLCGYRILCYACDKVHHSGTCFGTSPEDVTEKILTQAIEEGKSKLKGDTITWISKNVLDVVRVLMDSSVLQEHC